MCQTPVPQFNAVFKKMPVIHPLKNLLLLQSPSDVLATQMGENAAKEIRTSSLFVCLFVCFSRRFSQSTSPAPCDLQER